MNERERVIELEPAAPPSKYPIEAHCTNCPWKGPIDVPKGHPVPYGKPAGDAVACPDCGCFTLVREERVPQAAKPVRKKRKVKVRKPQRRAVPAADDDEPIATPTPEPRRLVYPPNPYAPYSPDRVPPVRPPWVPEDAYRRWITGWASPHAVEEHRAKVKAAEAHLEEKLEALRWHTETGIRLKRIAEVKADEQAAKWDEDVMQHIADL